MRTNVPGTVYLLHFNNPLHHAQHYMGWAEEGKLEKRLQAHRKGQGSSMTKAFKQIGAEFTVARTWDNVDRFFERKLKNQKNSPKLCPLCAEAPKTAAIN